MQLLKAKIPPTCEIILHGDSHEGNALTAYHELDRLIEYIKSKKNCYWIHMGDEIEARTVDHPYYAPETTDLPVPLAQMERCRDRYKPIAKKCLAWMYGNHPRGVKNFGNLTEKLCKEIGAPYGSWSCKLQLHSHKGDIAKLFLAHGYRRQITSNAKDYEQRNANMQARLKLMLQGKASDCLVMAIGDTHKLIHVPPSKKLLVRDDGEKLIQEYLGLGCGTDSYIEPDRRIYLNTGSFLKTFKLGVDSYSEVAGYDPIEIGYCKLHVKNNKITHAEVVNV